ncbi:MAG TPA: DUF1854 domain-containing protein [Gemmatimonadales bacterium]|nr:DUF1854 domain-containing protein [Gemmatimonadales bacterium]
MTMTLVGEPLAQRDTELTLEHRADGQLWVIQGENECAVRVRRAFPWSEPSRFLSLRDHEDVEIVLVTDPAKLDPESRHALEQALAQAGFVFDVSAVHAIDEEVEIRTWRVETRQGPRSFQTRLDDWPRTLPEGGLLIRDVAGDLYRLRQLARLDQKSRELLWAFVD